MVRKNRIQGLGLKRGRTQKIVPSKKGTFPRKEAYKSWRISTIGLVSQIIKFFLKLILSFIFGWIIRGAVITALIISITILYYKINMPPLNEMLDARAKGSVILLDKNKENFAWRGEQFGEIAQANKISIHLKNAILAVEDKRFYRHFGISPRGIAGAVRINLNEGRGALTGHGGSTITQQTAKLLCLGIPYKANNWDSEAQYEANCRQSSLWRKVKEALFAVALELEFTKDEILTLYLNRVFLGAGSRGFQAASQR